MSAPGGFVRFEQPGHPALWVRPGEEAAGGADAAIGQIRHNPSRILELNPGPGTRAVGLARAFPEAEIFSLATDLPTARLALLNTLPYPNIGFALLRHGGADGLIRRLVERGWDRYDTVIATAGPDVPVLGPWPESVRLVAIRGGEPVAAAYPGDTYVARTAADYRLFYRLVSTDLPGFPPRPVFDLITPRAAPVAFDAHCPGARLLRARVRAGAENLHATIRFHTDAEPDTLLAEDAIAANETRTIEAELPPWFGPCRINFTVAPEAAELEVLDAVLS